MYPRPSLGQAGGDLAGGGTSDGLLAVHLDAAAGAPFPEVERVAQAALGDGDRADPLDLHIARVAGVSSAGVGGRHPGTCWHGNGNPAVVRASGAEVSQDLSQPPV